MGGDDDDKWFVVGGRSRARKRHQDATSSRGGTSAVGTGAGTSCGGSNKCFNCRGIGHLQHQCPSRAGATLSRGRQTAGSHHGSLSNVSTVASTSSRGNNRKKPPPPKKHPQAGPSRGGNQPGRVYLRGHQRGAEEGEGPHDDVGVHSPKQAGDQKHQVLLRHGGGGR